MMTQWKFRDHISVEMCAVVANRKVQEDQAQALRHSWSCRDLSTSVFRIEGLQSRSSTSGVTLSVSANSIDSGFP